MDRIKDTISLDHLARLLVDVHVDTSKIVDSMLSAYQRSLLELVFRGDAPNRDKVRGCRRDACTPSPPLMPALSLPTGQPHSMQRDHAPPHRGGVHGQGRIRERAEAGVGGHTCRVRHQRARHPRLRRARHPGGRAQLATPRAPPRRVHAGAEGRRTACLGALRVPRALTSPAPPRPGQFSAMDIFVRNFFSRMFLVQDDMKAVRCLAGRLSPSTAPADPPRPFLRPN